MSQQPDPRSLFGHLWGSFQTAVNDPTVRAQPGGVQQYVWQSIRNDYLGRGENLPPGSFAAVNSLLSLAGQQRRAADQLRRSVDAYQRTGIDAAISSQHLAPDIDTRPLEAQLGGPRLRIRFMGTFAVGGSVFDQAITWSPGLEPPQTISGLLSGLEEAAQSAAQDYEWEYSGDASVLSITTT